MPWLHGTIELNAYKILDMMEFSGGRVLIAMPVFNSDEPGSRSAAGHKSQNHLSHCRSPVLGMPAETDQQSMTLAVFQHKTLF